MSILQEKSINFSLEIIQLFKKLQSHHSEYILSKQLLRSGTSIGANIREARNAESGMDFIHKLGIAQKETDETLYWLELLYKSNYISFEEYTPLTNCGNELLRMIRSSVLTKKKNLKNP